MVDKEINTAIDSDKQIVEQLKEQLDKFINIETGPYHSWDPVNQAMIRHWCDAMGDKNPVYTDADFADQSCFASIVAPPTMLQAWTMRNIHGETAPGSSDVDAMAALAILEQAGYPAVVAVNCEQEYFRYLTPADKIYYNCQIECISDEKTTALGRGFFVTQLSEFFNQDDEKIGLMRFRLLKYRPHAEALKKSTSFIGSSVDSIDNKKSENKAKPQRFHPPRNEDNNFFWQGLEEDKLLIQRCANCLSLRHPPGPLCPHCHSMEWDTLVASGRGKIYSFVIMSEPKIPPFNYPNPVGLIELEEGTRLIAQLVDFEPDAIAIGMSVEVQFNEVEEGLVLAQFGPLKS